MTIEITNQEAQKIVDDYDYYRSLEELELEFFFLNEVIESEMEERELALYINKGRF